MGFAEMTRELLSMPPPNPTAQYLTYSVLCTLNIYGSRLVAPG